MSVFISVSIANEPQSTYSRQPDKYFQSEGSSNFKHREGLHVLKRSWRNHPIISIIWCCLLSLEPLMPVGFDLRCAFVDCIPGSQKCFSRKKKQQTNAKKMLRWKLLRSRAARRFPATTASSTHPSPTASCFSFLIRVILSITGLAYFHI